MLGQFGNNWIKKNFSESRIGWGRMSSEFFSSNHFQIGEHVVLLHTAKSKKVALVIGHMEQCNDLLEWPPDNSFPMCHFQCPKQPLSNQLYSFFEEGCRKKMCTRPSIRGRHLEVISVSPSRAPFFLAYYVQASATQARNDLAWHCDKQFCTQWGAQIKENENA